MLALARKVNESIIINDNTTIIANFINKGIKMNYK